MAQIFKKTGNHPALLEATYSHVLPTLPVRDPNRPHVFFSFSSGKTDLGEIPIKAARMLVRGHQKPPNKR